MTDTAPIDALLETDLYKQVHVHQYKAIGNVTRVLAAWTNRKSRIAGVNHVVHFGLQAHLQRYLMDQFDPFFAADENTVIHMYEREMRDIFGSCPPTDHIRELHRLGFIPLRFCAVPEGTLVPIGVPSFTIENTMDDFAWVTNFVEPGISASVWPAQTSATVSHRYRLLLDAASDRTGANPADVDYQGHDFSFRGMFGHEGAEISAAAHLLSFRGTDTSATRKWVRRYYGGDFYAHSVPATEHSVMSIGTAVLGELETYSRLLDLYPTGIIAIVSDTYNLWRVLTEYLPALKDKIMARRGKLVIRPDSGVPERILLGDPASSNPAEAAGVVRLLGDTFGTTLNDAGFRRLDPHVGAIYGDGINLQRAEDITRGLEAQGWESVTSVLGIGSYSFQGNTRDTFNSAQKTLWAMVNGNAYNIFKDPITDDGTKKSATGRVAVLRSMEGELYLIQKATPAQEALSLLRPVWENGQFIKRQDFQDVRRTLHAG